MPPARPSRRPRPIRLAAKLALEQRRADQQDTARLTKVQGSVSDVTVSSVAHANGSATTVSQNEGRDFGKVSASTSQATTTYKVVKGDTLSTIAKRHAVEVAQLREWNHLKGDQIKLGQVLRISNQLSRAGVRILALTLDLDDTLWPVLPALERADQAVDAWLRQHHPEVARAWPIAAMRELRDAGRRRAARSGA